MDNHHYNLRGMTDFEVTSSKEADICLKCALEKCSGSKDCKRYKKEKELLKRESEKSGKCTK